MTRMTELDKKVLAIYEAIFALTPEESHKALMAYWDLLNQTCTKENPCLECQREHEAMALELQEPNWFDVN